MNERIRELIEQAVNAVDNPFPGNPLNDELEKMYIPDCFAEKFAELIVRECAELSVNSQYANTKSEYYEGFNEALIYVGNKIRKHFGVEE